MKPLVFYSILFSLILSGCGGGSSTDNSQPQPQTPPTSPIPENKSMLEISAKYLNGCGILQGSTDARLIIHDETFGNVSVHSPNDLGEFSVELTGDTVSFSLLTTQKTQKIREAIIIDTYIGVPIIDYGRVINFHEEKATASCNCTVAQASIVTPSFEGNPTGFSANGLRSFPSMFNFAESGVDLGQVEVCQNMDDMWPTIKGTLFFDNPSRVYFGALSNYNPQEDIVVTTDQQANLYPVTVTDLPLTGTAYLSNEVHLDGEFQYSTSTQIFDNTGSQQFEGVVNLALDLDNIANKVEAFSIASSQVDEVNEISFNRQFSWFSEMPPPGNVQLSLYDKEDFVAAAREFEIDEALSLPNFDSADIASYNLTLRDQNYETIINWRIKSSTSTILPVTSDIRFDNIGFEIERVAFNEIQTEQIELVLDDVMDASSFTEAMTLQNDGLERHRTRSVGVTFTRNNPTSFKTSDYWAKFGINQ